MTYRRQERAIKKAKRTVILKVIILSIFSILIIFLLQKAFFLAINKIADLKVKFIVADQGVIEERIDAKALIIIKEDLYISKKDGRFENLVKEKQKIRLNSNIGYFIDNSGTKTLLKAPSSGIFTKKIDGLEQSIENIDLDNLSIEIFSNKNKKEKIQNDLIDANTPVFKVIDNFSPMYLLIMIADSELKEKINESQLKIVYENKILGKVKLINLKEEADHTIILLELDHFAEKLMSNRFIEVELIYNLESGYIIPEKALIEVEGKKGIYTMKGERVNFKEVEVFLIRDEQAVVKGLLPNEILVENPDSIKIRTN